jgi:predicted nucleic acid-binding protein
MRLLKIFDYNIFLPNLAFPAFTRRSLIIKDTIIPEKASTDALHIAVATRHGIDFLLTWNCTHIANAEIMRMVDRVMENHGFEMPVICTPDELMGGVENDK